MLRGLGEPVLLLVGLPLLIGACAGFVASSSGTATWRREDLELRRLLSSLELSLLLAVGASWVSELDTRSSRREEDLEEGLDGRDSEPSA